MTLRMLSRWITTAALVAWLPAPAVADPVLASSTAREACRNLPACQAATLRCNDGNGSACLLLAGWYLGDALGARDVATGYGFAAKGCEARDPDACALAASLVRSGDGSPAEPSRARDLLERGCRLGDGAQCLAAGRMRDDPTSSKALALFQEGCDLGHTKSCESAATFLYMAALEMAEPFLARRAFRYLTRMCAEGGPVAEPFCKQVADCLIDGFGVAADEATGERMLKEQCENHPGGGACADLGDRYLTGDGVRPSVVEARSVMDRGCQAGDTGSCETLARL